MTIEKNREIINSIKNPDSLKAVQVAFNINESQDKVIDKLVNLIQEMDKNMKLLAVKVLELEKKNWRPMSNEKIEALEIGLYEDYLEELQKKYYGGINKVLGEPWFTKTDAEMEAEAEKKVKEFMDRNS